MEFTPNDSHIVYDKKRIELLEKEIKSCTDKLALLKKELEITKNIIASSCPVCNEALKGSVYRPRCSACPWDSHEE